MTAGWPTAVYNRTPGQAEGLPAATLRYARIASSRAEAARDAEIGVTMLAKDAAVAAVTFGQNGLLSALPGRLFLTQRSGAER